MFADYFDNNGIYWFIGWFDKPNGQGKQYAKVTKREDGMIWIDSVRAWDKNTPTATLYGYWTFEPVVGEFTVTFDKQGGTGGTSSVTFEYGKLLRNISIPTNSGYTFQGYYTKKNGQGVKYVDSTGAFTKWMTDNHDIILYAYWK